MREDTTLIPRCDLKSLFRSTDGGKGGEGGEVVKCRVHRRP